MVVHAFDEKLLLLLLSLNRKNSFIQFVKLFVVFLLINAILLGSRIEVSRLLVIIINSNPRYEVTES